ncbi:glycosyltransferase family 4 protein [Proteinivorax tanatarense]|uniref:Glycosyltransferase family 4 protein n=1 Tax=Proteinivorax tanatarense TaxID=1260629 RepID=A0AAU7VHT3_9FIRM
MKILHIANTDFFIKKLMLNKLKGLQSKGYEVHVMAPFCKYRDDIIEEGITTHNIDIHREIRPFKDLVAIFKLARYLKKYKFTIVHTHSSKAGIIGRTAAKLAKVPYIIHTSHGLSFYSNQKKIKFHAYKLCEKFVGRFTDIIFSQNHEDLNQIRKYNLVPNQRAIYEGNGVNIDEIKNNIKQKPQDQILKKYNIKDKFVIGLYARLEPVKGHLFFLKALKKYIDETGDDKIIVLLAGGNFGYESDYEQKIDEKIKQLNLQHYIKKVGYVEDITELLAITQLVVLPSKKEGLPRIIMESMTAQIPVIGTDVLGTREIIKDQHTGTLVPYGEVTAMTEALKELIGKPCKREQYKKNGIELILNNFDENLVVERLHREYSKLLFEQSNKHINKSKN